MPGRRELYRFAKNALANVARGGAGSMVAFLLPPFLTRSMSREAFGAWALVIQLGAYVGYFDFGIQTALARFVAHSSERGDLEYRNRVVSSAFAMLAVSGGLAFLGILALVLFLPELFHQLRGSLIPDVRVALLLVGGSLAVCLPCSAFASLFVGLQRNEVPAATTIIPKVGGAALIVVAVHLGGGIRSLAAITASGTFLAFLLQYLAYKRWVPGVELKLNFVSLSVVREPRDYCLSLTIWGVGLLLVTGLDVAIVAAFRFKDVGYYAIAATPVTFFTGLFGAFCGAMGAPAATLHARDDGAGLGRLVSTSTRFGVLLLLLTGVPLIVAAYPLLRVWVGADYAQHATPILQLLLIANILRVCVSPYMVAMISTGEQKHIILVPLLEGAVNLVCSLIAGYFLGAIGVAWGTLIGASVSVGGHIVYTMRRGSVIQLKTSEYVRQSLLRPFLCATPAVVPALLWPFLSRVVPSWFAPAGGVIVGLISIYLLWKFAITLDERQKTLTFIRLVEVRRSFLTCWYNSLYIWRR